MLLSACGGSGSNGDGDTAEVETSTVVAADVTSVPSSRNLSSATSTARPVTTSTDMSVAPSSTVDPVAVAKAQVEAAFAQQEEVWLTCLSQLPTCDVATLASVYTGTQLTEFTNLARSWNTAGYMARNNESLTYRVDSVHVVDPASKVILTVCLTDGGVLFAPAGESGPEQLISDTWVSSREAWTWVRGSDGVWRAETNVIVTQPVVGEENNVCV
jgi:hypothetical protein